MKDPAVIEGQLNGSGKRIAVVVARFTGDITDRLLASCLKTLTALNVDEVTTHRVPGALELGVAARALAETGDYHAVVCLGCVIRGETSHYDAVVDGARQGIVQASQDTGVPVIFGVLTTENKDQAMARTDESRKSDTGAYAARAAVEMADLIQQITRP